MRTNLAERLGYEPEETTEERRERLREELAARKATLRIVKGLCLWTSGAAMILSQDPVQALQFIVFLVVLQQIEGHLIYPNVVGQSVGLPSIWVFVAVIAGGSLFGLLGVLLGVPVISTIRTLAMEHFAKQDAENALRREDGTVPQ